MLDIEKYKYFLSMTAKKYSYLGYGDVYNELVTYLLQAQRDGVKDPQSYAMNRLKTFIRKETKARKVINYGLEPKG